ncbi:hypothetical protein IEO21_10880 [Rhodonia placenta]|uniref:Uncharacterized protein n=1 Tax=Rhodonia placenta TaxID=104341 RepID=A0A8H7TWW8_9APHY|nr:hypothetical protein IEO21_10880 [Postia placenta]
MDGGRTGRNLIHASVRTSTAH